MKHLSKIPTGEHAAVVDARKKRTQDEPDAMPEMNAETEAIHMRANQIGSVLEGILRIHHDCKRWNQKIQWVPRNASC